MRSPDETKPNETGIYSGNTLAKQTRPALHFEARQCGASSAVDKLESRLGLN